MILMVLGGFSIVAQGILKSPTSVNGKPGHFAYAPSMKPVFKTVADSAQYQQLQQWMSMSNPPIARDSIWPMFVRLMNRATRYKPVYQGERDFKNLSEIGDDELGTATRISIQITSKIDKRILKCHQVVALELVNTSVRKVPSWLNKLDSLKSIRVVNNQSRRPLKIGRNKQIQTLVIRGDRPDALPKRYAQLKNLKTLDLCGTKLQQIPSSVFACKRLQSLILKGNFITLNNYAFPVQKSLDRLDLSANQIKVVPGSIGNLTALTKLVFSYNDVETIEPGLSRLANLTQFSLYSNNIKTFPEELYELRNLRELDLYFNEFERLDNRIENWQQLEILYLANNKLIAVPETIGKLKNLREVYLHNNRISSLPEGITQLPHLRVLRVNKNGIMALPDSINQLQLLENLDISQNRISSLPEGFWSYSKLKILGLSLNPWEESIRSIIQQKTEELRARNIVVNVGDVVSEN